MVFLNKHQILSAIWRHSKTYAYSDDYTYIIYNIHRKVANKLQTKKILKRDQY